MMKKIAGLMCVFFMFYATPAFSYQKEAKQNQKPQEETTPTQGDENKGGKSSGGQGLMIAGYMLIGLGGAAAIAGSTVAAASSKKVAGIIIGSSGAALGLAGSFMVLFGSRQGYGLGPQVDPSRQYYGLNLAANF